MTIHGQIDKVAPLETGHYPALGFDPAPGAVARVSEVATNLGTVARELGEAYSDISQIGRSGGIWEGEAAEAFQGQVGELPDYLDKAHRSLSGASTTLGDWAADLTTMQQQAREFERLAAEALARVESAESNPNLGLRGQIFTDPAELQRAEDALANAERALSSAKDSLDQIRENARRLLDQHHDLAGQVAEALRKAKDEAPEEPGLLDKIGDAFGDLIDGIKELASDVWNWIEEHAELIAQIGEVLSVIGNVLGVVALATSWIPGVNAVTAAAAIGVSAAAAGTKLLAKAAGADVSWGSIAMDAVGVIPGGKVVAGAKNAVVQAARTSTAASKVPGLGLKAVTGIGGDVVKIGSKPLKINGQVIKIGGQDVSPITAQALRANPGEAIEQAARYSHGKAVDLANKIPGVNLTPFSNAGIVTGTAAQSGMGVAKAEAKDYAADKLTGG